ncbi:uncharacterized protein GGS22DRAFT_157901 [Annulohypoxylon maeteangense]|uniref:uncharacterized protein n=1 Tax=Annulohypoxylon maeteangense TaxID=1927788 RepID=UPI002008400E|nr:uncharacterized protein GGS22DRAFT_157901 [Annulohypoxylon maeteangense]KAI0886461.1 hypothetical protein GGS22DRAFT_157901 [Annulohypoxylon maeteangense]
MASEDTGDVLAQQDGALAWSADGWNGADDQTSPDDEDGGEYDPESVTITSVPAPAVERPASESPRPIKKAKTAGGFIIENSSDEEDDTPAPAPVYTPNTLKPIPSEAQGQPFSNLPLQQNLTPQDATNDSPQANSEPVPSTTTPTAATANAIRSRLPADVVGILEDRIKEDPRGDIEAWLGLIDEQKRRHKIEDARAVYERFLKVFPQAAEIWVAYLEMELSLDNTVEAESIFTRTLRAIPDVQLWTGYLNYIRRRNDLNDTTGRARQTVSQSYEFVLNNIGQDRDAGSIWQDYIHFIKTGPGQIGGAGWQDQQKMDVLRKAYQRAISIPMANVNTLWKEYDMFEMGLNKMTGRKFLQERSPSYMTARSANTHLENITRGLKKTTLPRLPPAPGFEGNQEYLEQVRLWKIWIAWEKNDPLVLQTDDSSTYRQRVLQVYKQALMALRFWPELWVDAAEWCFDNNVTSEDGQDTGLQFLVDGLEANPESFLLALKHADRIESTQAAREDDVNKAALVQTIREPCDRVLETLYGMAKKLKDQETSAIAKIEEDATLESVAPGNTDVDEEDEGEIKEKPSLEAIKKARIKTIQDGFGVQIQMLSQHITYVWISLARIYRRLQGQGHGRSTPSVGLRGIFIEARQRGRLTSDIYVEVSNMEWDIYQDAVGTKIYERGAKLFPEQEDYFVEYLKHLHAKRDFTNARVVFSQTVKRFKEKPELIPKLKPIYGYFHGYEARYGELAQVKELEKQMAELFPEDPSLAHFAARFATDRFDPITAPVIISAAKQMRSRAIMQSVEQRSVSPRNSPRPMAQIERSPQPQFMQPINSPKRPFQPDEQDEYPPRKLARGASPLKGAAGRRLDQQRRAQQGQGISSHISAPTPIPRDLTFLIGLLPPTESYHGHHFSADGMVRLVQNTSVPSFGEWKAQKESASRNSQSNSTAHIAQASSEYQPYQYSNRDSPGPSGRPASPFGGMNRGMPQASAPYRNSPLRPGSSGSYEPPPAVYQAPSTGQFNPLAQNLVPGSSGFPGWPGYAPPTQYGMAPTQQHTQQYGGGYYQ